ncbi:MAG: hypothetical protein SPL22_12640 [Treponema sp.]|uniref:hypothetical protein n=1 Tax=Treponema sp. TaxID=166 RepID=UPI002A909652|nr:hypothetical protein [Treponema sp.]MDY6398563.1 hypothetical protein [Treponema sp.]
MDGGEKMSIEYITLCEKCRLPYSFETGLAYMFFHNDGFHKDWISSFGNKLYRKELKEYLETDKSFCSPIDKRVYGCPKCNVVYNVEILENFKPDFLFKCDKCKVPLQRLELKTEIKHQNSYIKFLELNKTKFVAHCPECNHELLGLIDKEICND